jgi:outer membrane protein TolC
MNSVTQLLPVICIWLAVFCPLEISAAESTTPASTALTLSVKEAVLISLEQNLALRVQRFGPQISRTAEEQAAAAFDLNLVADLNVKQNRSEVAGGDDYKNSSQQSLALGVNRFFATGTTLDIALESTHTAKPEADSSRLGLSVTQALLRGRGTDVNLAAIRQAQIDSTLSDYELHAYTESFVARVEAAYWDYLLAAKRLEIVERSLKIAEAQLAEVRERIAVGRLAEIEQAAADAETAVRREALINAKSALAKARLNLLKLLNKPGSRAFDLEISLIDQPALPPVEQDPVDSHIALASRLRDDLRQARLKRDRGELEVVKTRNGLLPKLDLFVNLGKTGYSSSFAGSADLSGEGYDVQAGLAVRFPWENRAARAAEKRAVLSREQAEISIMNLAQLVEVDVRGAWIEINRLREQVSATEVSRRLQEEKLRAETEKFRVGKSTTFLVAQAQRDLLLAETESVSAVIECMKAVIELYRLEGSLLERRGITVEQPAGT